MIHRRLASGRVRLSHALQDCVHLRHIVRVCEVEDDIRMRGKFLDSVVLTESSDLGLRAQLLEHLGLLGGAHRCNDLEGRCPGVLQKAIQESSSNVACNFKFGLSTRSPGQCGCLWTYRKHRREGYSSYWPCLSVCLLLDVAAGCCSKMRIVLDRSCLVVAFIQFQPGHTIP